MAVCCVENGPALTRWEKTLVRLAVRFSKVTASAKELSVEEILDELAGDATVALRERDRTTFEEKYSEIAKLHRTLLDASLPSYESPICDRFVQLRARLLPRLRQRQRQRRKLLAITREDRSLQNTATRSPVRRGGLQPRL